MRRIIMSILALAAVFAASAQDVPFIEHGKPDRLLEFDLHGLMGGSYVTQNYRGCFPQISEMALTMGPSGGVGASAYTGFTRFIGLGLEVNFLINTYRNNMAVADDDATSITNVFVQNRYFTLNFPVYIRLSFNIAPKVVWFVDAGGYYAYGVSGRSRTTYYSAQVNPVGQLITTVTGDRTDYYNSPETFIASSMRGDYGLHVATGLLISRRVSVGIRTQIGFKNTSRVYDAVTRPNVHNFNLFATLGWHF